MNINWYPGHMKKTKDLLRDNVKLVDLIIEVIDSRIPASSKNPDFDDIFKGKKRLIVMNKYDLADPAVNKEWEKYYRARGWYTVLYNSTDNRELKKLDAAIAEASKDIAEKYAKKGLTNRSIKAMIVGIPNVGKSTLINSLAKKKSAKTGNMPGVTKGKQWIRLSGNIDLLDTPGILWPKFKDDEGALNLAYTGAIKDEVLVLEEIVFKFVEKMYKEGKSSVFAERYGINEDKDTPLSIIEAVANKRSCTYKKYNEVEVDYLRVSKIILGDYRDGKLGRISLERPGE